MGAAKVRDLFKQAKEKAPCIVFIDEIDTIGKKRDSGSFTGGNDEREQTLNQLLTEMDGFDGIQGCCDPGSYQPSGFPGSGPYCRPGRFDRRIPVELPDLKGREEILKVHAQKDQNLRRVSVSMKLREGSSRRFRCRACQYCKRGSSSCCP